MSTVVWREDGGTSTEPCAVSDVERTLGMVTARSSGRVEVSNVVGFGVRVLTVVRLVSSMIMNSF